jgi:shikimate dehydrogenase
MGFLGIEGMSARLEADDMNRETVVALMESFNALSVTFPLKESMFDLCDIRDDVSLQIGAVNSVYLIDGQMIGRNVDGEGFYRAAVEELDFDSRDANVVVLGAGGAARSVIAALLQHGVGRVDVVMREDRGQLAPFIGDDRVSGVSRSEMSADLIINATPVSLTGGTLDSAIYVPSSSASCVDLSYQPAETEWMKEMRQISPRVVNGKSMLLWQAKLQLDWWFDADIPISVLREAVA